MNYFTKDDLLANIDGLTNYHVVSFEGGNVVFSEYGGRLLGIFPKENCVSPLWINPRVENELKSRAWNIGGDRWWISPERNFYYKNPEKWDVWFCPEGLDPANHKFTLKSNKGCTVSSDITFDDQIAKTALKGNITRTFQVVNELYSTDLPYCGVKTVDECTINEPDFVGNSWSLAQVISGGYKNTGTILIPTKSNPKPLSYFRTIPQYQLKVGADHVSFKIDVSNIYKLAIRPEDIDFSQQAKIGYILKVPGAEEWFFLVKISEDVPKTQDQCFDISRDHPDSEIGVIQSYNSESPNMDELMFGEMEFQMSMFEKKGDISSSTAIHQLFAYIGEKEEILEVAEIYLGIKEPNLF